MQIPPEHSPNWSRQEWDLINVTELFKCKPAIMKKAERFLEELRSALAEELVHHSGPFPAETDLAKGQIARGENHKGFPFLSLDLPQKFSKTEFFTFRTLFWWGHYLGFSLILKGPELDNWVRPLKERRGQPEGNGVFISRHANPWEWEFNGENFVRVSELSPQDIESLADSLQYVKLMRVFPLCDQTFLQLDWKEAGLQTFRDLMQCVLK